jgi:hypothetical protein
MLTAIIILALLSLLVATEGDPASAQAEPSAEKPARPAAETVGADKTSKPSRVAA